MQEQELRKQELIARQETAEETLARVTAERERELALRRERKALVQQMRVRAAARWACHRALACMRTLPAHTRRAVQLANVERQRRKEEYMRLKTLQHVQAMEARTDVMMSEKEQLLERRKRAAIRAKIQRDLIAETMEKVRTTKKWDHATETLGSTFSSSMHSEDVRAASRASRAVLRLQRS